MGQCRRHRRRLAALLATELAAANGSSSSFVNFVVEVFSSFVVAPLSMFVRWRCGCRCWTEPLTTNSPSNRSDVAQTHHQTWKVPTTTTTTNNSMLLVFFFLCVCVLRDFCYFVGWFESRFKPNSSPSLYRWKTLPRPYTSTRRASTCTVSQTI